MGDFVTQLAMQGVDILGNQLQAGQQYKRQKKLMDIQQRNQMALNEQGRELQMQTWKDTNYPAQVEMLKSAGLNPGLLYAKGGTGGTTGGQSGGSAASGSAQQAPPIDIASKMAMQSVIELNKANANKANTEAEILKGGGANKLAADTEAAKAGAGKATAEAELLNVNKRIAEIEESNKQNIIDANLKQVGEMIRSLKANNEITEGTAKSKIQEAASRAIGATLENELTKAKVSLTKEETWKIGQEIDIKFQEVLNQVTSLTQKDREIELHKAQIAISKFEQELKAKYPSMGNVAGMVLKKAYQSLEMLTGGGIPKEDKINN